MAQFDGSTGWIALAAESVAYGTLGTSLVYQHGVAGTPTFNESRPIPPVLGSVAAHTGRRLHSYYTLPVTLAHTDEDDDVSVLYDHFGNDDDTANDYVFGATPDITSLSVFCDYNGVEYDLGGGVASSITWNLANQDYSTVNVDFMGRTWTKYGGAARTPSIPPSSEIVLPGDLDTFTVGGTPIAGITGATITYSRQVTGIDRQRLGGNTLPQPIIFGRPTISATFNLELDDADGNDTVDEIDNMLADTAAGAIVLDNFSLSGCQMVGDLPEVGRGLRPLTFRVIATGLTVTTS